jgi:hypothetical protein
MDEELYDEFGNYVGPEMNDSDESSEEEHEEEQDEEDERSEQGATAGPLVSFPLVPFFRCLLIKILYSPYLTACILFCVSVCLQ